MGAVTSKEGYNFQGKKFCKEIFHFFQNDGLPTHFQANSPSPFDVESVWDILNIWFSKISTQNLRRYNVQPLATAVHYFFSGSAQPRRRGVTGAGPKGIHCRSFKVTTAV